MVDLYVESLPTKSISLCLVYLISVIQHILDAYRLTIVTLEES